MAQSCHENRTCGSQRGKRGLSNGLAVRQKAGDRHKPGSCSPRFSSSMPRGGSRLGWHGRAEGAICALRRRTPGPKEPVASMKRMPVLPHCGRRTPRLTARTAARQSLALGNSGLGGPCPCHPHRIRQAIWDAPGGVDVRTVPFSWPGFPANMTPRRITRPSVRPLGACGA